MNAPRFAKLAGALMAEQERQHEDEAMPQVDLKDRARAIDVIEQAIRQRAKKKTRVRWMTGAAAIAASLLALASTKMLMHARAPGAMAAGPISVAVAHANGNVSVTSPGGAGISGAAADGANVAAGSRIVTHDGGHAVLALSTGTRLAIDDASDFSVVEEDQTQIFSLASGSMRADVAKLRSGQRFIIRTADAEIEVHGTSFSVGVVPSDAACGNGSTTRVVVYEGVVTVRHAGDEARVPKGDSWPANCATTASTTPSDATPASSTVLELPNDAPQTNAPTTATHSSHATNHSRKSGSSPLAEENDIFESGLTAERDGLTAGAISDFERYLSLYPNGPLAEHAAVRRMNLLRTTDHARAVQAAKDYLARYPNGFARSDANAIVAEKP